MSEASGTLLQDASQVLGRVRAWFLIKTKDITPTEAAETIHDKWIYDKGGIVKNENLVVIRADVIELRNNNSCDFELIVPVDALDGSVLEAFKNDLQTIPGIGKVIVANVKHHFPKAPYISNGYISLEEGDVGEVTYHIDPEDKELGLTRKSPGDNPWG